MTELPTAYRPCVGVMLVNNHKQVFVGKRIDYRENSGAVGEFWQMPQGGVDPGEDLYAAAMRELAEETGVREEHVLLHSRLSQSLRYDLPEHLIGKLWKGQYRGQEQMWFLAKFSGSDADIDLEAHDPPEFCEWKWAALDELEGLIVPFKRDVYRHVVAEFEPLLG